MVEQVKIAVIFPLNTSVLMMTGFPRLEICQLWSSYPNSGVKYIQQSYRWNMVKEDEWGM